MDTDVGAFLNERLLNDREGIRSAEELWEFLVNYRDHEKFRMPKGGLYYRGQSNSMHGLNSTLYRLIAGRRSYSKTPSEFKHDAEAAMRDAEDKVLAMARKNGLGMGLTDLELLGLLQHHGMPTRLIDVSRSPLAALYFAVEMEDDKDGRLFILTAKETLKHGNPTHPHESAASRLTALPWAAPRKKTSNWRQTVYEATMSPLDARMIAQQASFLVGGIYTSGGKLQQYFYGSSKRPIMINIDSLREISTLIICFQKKDYAPRKATSWGAYGWSFLIPSDWKPFLRQRLSELNPPIERDSMYPPISEVKRLISHVAAEALNG